MDFWSGSAKTALLISTEWVIAFGSKMQAAMKTWVILKSGNAHSEILALKQKSWLLQFKWRDRHRVLLINVIL